MQTTYLESADRDDFSDVSSESVHILVFMIDFFYGVALISKYQFLAKTTACQGVFLKFFWLISKFGSKYNIYKNSRGVFFV